MEELKKFILCHESGVRLSRGALISPGFVFALAQKSGWSDDPADAGGATMLGVTLSTYRGWCKKKGYPQPGKQSLRRIPYGHWALIFRDYFWDYCKCDEIRSRPTAWLLADWVWGSGPKVIKRVQRILGVTADGIIGPKTLGAINGRDPRELFSAIKNDRGRYLQEICSSRPANLRFLKGWQNRLSAITYEGLEYYAD